MTPQPDPYQPIRRTRPPAINAPGVVLALIALLVVVHLFRVYLSSPATANWLILNLSFIPGCYGLLDEVCTIRSPGADLWTPASYMLLHGDALHVGLNSLWLLVFGTPVARRLGAQRFMAFSVAGSVAGALLFFLANPSLVAPVIGASGAVSALMGGASRFALPRSGGAGFMRARTDLPLEPIRSCLTNRTVLVFVAVFFATNLLFSTGLGGAFGPGNVAWEAHLGGFVFGFLGFALFDRRNGRTSQL
ncbi:rhomboid family intramembrane serine protease [Fulvimarina sp. 2208YS6-2-32]|uniref:Rhomboid family intramembrane serine protease n=1 Tax=Fulvimarina uroteuthidis TaxID=3098149 RepID=A0ABU5I756_9HYPH|nr:rhomboid family intramembrane serine protease [Fulvimarina sp. 2208YS6-2-32]MDY8110980.1 rhomboid family intramembrane serine protease [Fulvimarina sp. 2208YS6-2-32]